MDRLRQRVAQIPGLTLYLQPTQDLTIDAETEKPFEQPLTLLPPVAFGDTEAHLEQGDDRHPDFGACAQLFLKPLAKRRIAPAQNRNDNTGIEANHSSKKTRGLPLD